MNVLMQLFLLRQTLCILANIADGNTAKELLMTNDDMLQKIKYYMVQSAHVCWICFLLVFTCYFISKRIRIKLLIRLKKKMVRAFFRFLSFVMII